MSIKMRTDWKGDLKGQGICVSGDTSISLAIPGEFGGSGEGLGPKELYLSSTAACFLMSLKMTLYHSKIDTPLLQIESYLTSQGEQMSITHQLHVVVTRYEDRDRLPKLIEIADKNCLIGGLAKRAGIAVVIEPEITCTSD